MVSYKAIPAVGKGRKVGQRGGGEPKLTFKVAYRKLEASQRYEATEPAVGGLHAQSQGRYLESEANTDNKWQKIVVEAKATKRQWADLEDSDEEAQALVVVR